MTNKTYLQTISTIIRIVRWLITTLAYAYLAPWLLIALFGILTLHWPQSFGSVRETITWMATADSRTWQQGEIEWTNVFRFFFLTTVVYRIFTAPFAKSLGRTLDVSFTTWLAVSDRRRRGFFAVSLFAVFATAAIALTSGSRPIQKLSARRRPPIAPSIEPSAALCLHSGQIISGGATISAAGRETYLVRFTPYTKQTTATSSIEKETH